MKTAFIQGLRVTSISRAGKPHTLDSSLESAYGSSVVWVKADIFNESQWVKDLKGADAVISCVGAFGSNQVRVN